MSSLGTAVAAALLLADASAGARVTPTTSLSDPAAEQTSGSVDTTSRPGSMHVQSDGVTLWPFVAIDQESTSKESSSSAISGTLRTISSPGNGGSLRPLLTVGDKTKAKQLSESTLPSTGVFFLPPLTATADDATETKRSTSRTTGVFLLPPLTADDDDEPATTTSKGVKNTNTSSPKVTLPPLATANVGLSDHSSSSRSRHTTTLITRLSSGFSSSTSDPLAILDTTSDSLAILDTTVDPIALTSEISSDPLAILDTTVDPIALTMESSSDPLALLSTISSDPLAIDDIKTQTPDSSAATKSSSSSRDPPVMQTRTSKSWRDTKTSS